jgi:hypothetical protein
MLEQALTELFDQQAGENQPAARASIGVAARQGKARLRRRRTVSVVAPLLMAAAVLAIALAGTLPRQAPEPPAQHGGPDHSRPAASLKVLNPLAALGWLPPGFGPVLADLRHTEDLFEVANGKHTPRNLLVWATGVCSFKPAKLTCTGITYHLTGRAPAVKGRPAYWAPGGAIVFQYARDSWADAIFGSHADDLAIAAHLTIRSHVTPARYPAQLTGLPGWGILSVGTVYVHGIPEADAYGLATGNVLRNPPAGDAPVTITIRKAGSLNQCGPGGQAKVINGYRVSVSGGPAQGWNPASQYLCSANADGLYVQIAVIGSHPVATATQIFAHLKLYGPDPAKWTTRPIG